MEITPQKIYRNYDNKLLDKSSAIQDLISFIENSEKVSVRIKSIEILNKIGIKDNSMVFKILENLLISDSYEKIRNAAAEALKLNFIDRALVPIKWALYHEESPLCLSTVYKTFLEIIKNLEKMDDSNSRAIMIGEIKNIKEKEFTISIKNGKLEILSGKEIADNLINYYTLYYLEKTFWRLKSKIKHCKVIELDFKFKGVNEIPESIKYLFSLKKLILRYNQISIVPEWIETFSDLEVLNLNVNNISELPHSIGSLSSLKILSLWKNELKCLPNSICLLNSLEILNLRLNQLNNLPDAIGNLSSLVELNMHDNKLTEVPTSIGNLHNLNRLNLSWNDITSISNSIGSLSSLKQLDLGNNELKTIPDSIGSLNSLETLDLSENKLSNVPETLGNLNSLQILNLSRNEITSLPKTFESFTSLKELYLGGNQLKNNFSKILKKLENNGVKIYY